MLHLVKVANPFIVLVMWSLMVVYLKFQQREQPSLTWYVAAHTVLRLFKITLNFYIVFFNLPFVVLVYLSTHSIK